MYVCVCVCIWDSLNVRIQSLIKTTHRHSWSDTKMWWLPLYCSSVMRRNIVWNKTKKKQHTLAQKALIVWFAGRLEGEQLVCVAKVKRQIGLNVGNSSSKSCWLLLCHNYRLSFLLQCSSNLLHVAFLLLNITLISNSCSRDFLQRLALHLTFALLKTIGPWAVSCEWCGGQRSGEPWMNECKRQR